MVNQIEKLNRIANRQNRKRPGTPINKRGAHIVTLFFGIYTGAAYIYSAGLLSMNTQRTLLLGIIITAVAILFVETGVIQFNNQGINAQTELSELILEKDGERVTISKGDWVIAINAANSDIFGGGELLGVTAEGI